MDFRLLCLLIILKWVHAHQTVLSAVARQRALYFHPMQPYPAYKIVTKSELDSTEAPAEVSLNSSSITTNTVEDSNSDSNLVTLTNETSDAAPPPLEASTANTIYTPAEFPHDLLEIARSKLDLKSLDEVPSLSELAEYLGTTNSEETINYIRKLTSTNQGIELIKAYLESADFTDRTEESRRQQQVQTRDVLPTAAIDDPTKLSKNSLLGRIAAYFHIYNIWPQSNGTAQDATAERKQIQQQLSKYIKPQLHYRKRMHAAHRAATHAGIASPHHRPLLVRNPLPYHYPIPLRPVVGQRFSSEYANAAGNPFGFAPVHLNTPRFYVPPPHIQLARAANITPEQLQSLLQSKPKLAELATKVSNLPLTKERSALINTQVLAAVRRAVEQDDDLRELLQATAETLK